MFSVIIPLYNKASFIRKTLESVLSQTYQKYEILIIDDGSTDNGVDVIERSFKDSRIRVITQLNQGVAAARNKGIDYANFDYVAFLDADDLWCPEYLSVIHDVICHNSDADIVGSHYKIIHSYKEYPDSDTSHLKLNYRKIKNYFKTAHTNTLFTCSSTVVKTSLLKALHGFRNTLSHGEDSDLWFRVMMEGNAYYINNTLVYYYMGDPNQATKKLGKIEKTLVGNILEFYRASSYENKVPYFHSFIRKYVLLNLMPYYIDRTYHKEAKSILRMLKNKPLLPSLFYMLPRNFAEKTYSSAILRKGFRKLAKL